MSAPVRISTTSLIVIVAVAAALGLWLGARVSAPVAAPQASLRSAKLYPEPRPIAPFHLNRAGSGGFSEQDLRGHWSLLFFGYIHCPDVCPTTLGTFAQVEKELARTPSANAVSYVFISLDPERDTAQAVSEYSAYFSPRIVAAVGDLDTLNAMTPNLGVVFIKAPQPGGDYLIDHSASVLLVDPQGRLAGLFRPPFDAQAIAADLLQLAAGR